jgi:hypothetical protein
MVALLVIFAVALCVILFREKLAGGLPWLRVLRRADMQKQEEQIIQAAITLERQLSMPDTVPQREPSSACRPDGMLTLDQPDQSTDSTDAAPAIAMEPKGEKKAQELTLQLDSTFQQELAASAARKCASIITADGSALDAPLSPDTPGSAMHRRGVSLGPGQLFAPRASLLPRFSHDSPLSPSGVQPPPLQHARVDSASGVRVHVATEGAAATAASAMLPALRHPRPPVRILLMPLTRTPAVPVVPAPVGSTSVSAPTPEHPSEPEASAPSLMRKPSVLDIDRVLDEHEQHKFQQSHAHERERRQQMRRAQQLKEERRMLKEAAQAAAAAHPLDEGRAGSSVSPSVSPSVQPSPRG